MYDLKDKNIIVIGGSSGIGHAVAQMAHQFGARVTITGRDTAKSIEAAQKIAPTVKARVLDIGSEAAVEEFFRSVDQVDHIYIAAGATRLGSITEGLLEEHLQYFDVRFRGSLRVVKAAHDKIRPSGSIVFTGGISTDRPIAGAWVSGLGTASAEQLARVLVMEFPGIRFNAVSPGYTDTPMWDAIMGENKTTILDSVAQTLPVKKIASPQEVASAVLFLMSNASITGEVIHIDGGGRLV